MQSVHLFLVDDDGNSTEHDIVLPAGVDEGEYLRVPASSEATPDKEEIYAEIIALVNICDAGNQSLEVVARRIGNREWFLKTIRPIRARG